MKENEHRQDMMWLTVKIPNNIKLHAFCSHCKITEVTILHYEVREEEHIVFTMDCPQK